MKISVIAGLIVGIHVVVIASVAMQGCTVTRPSQTGDTDTVVAPPPAPPMPPSVEPVAAPAPAQPVAFKPVAVQPPAPPAAAPATAQPKVYVVQNGDSLSKIAAKHGCRTSDLKELNNIKDANKILVGQKLMIPDGAQVSAPAKAAAPAAAPKAGPGEYIVQNGDALSKIAAKHGCKTKDLMELNNIKDPNKIRIGQRLKLPGAAPAAAEPAAAPEAPAPAEPEKADWVAPLPAAEPAAAVAEPAPAPEAAPAVEGVTEVVEMEDVLDYTVQNGDTIESIARLFVVGSADIRKLNGIAADADVKPGQLIRIPPTSL